MFSCHIAHSLVKYFLLIYPRKKIIYYSICFNIIVIGMRIVKCVYMYTKSYKIMNVPMKTVNMNVQTVFIFHGFATRVTMKWALVRAVYVCYVFT